MIILCVVMLKSVITILLKKTCHFALLNHNFFEVGGRVIQAICTMFGYAFIKKHGWILKTNCWCMAGLGSACNHVAALLFKIEKAIHVRETDDTSPTNVLFQWKSIKKTVETIPTQLVNFSRVNKDNLTFVPSLSCSYLKNFSGHNPMAGEIPLTKE